MRAYSTLLWEQWRQTGLLLVAMLLSVLAVQVLGSGLGDLFRGLGLRDSQQFAASLTWFFAGISVLLLFVHEDTRGLRLDFPRRMLTSPLSTWKLVTIPFAYRLLLISCVGLAMTGQDLYTLDAVSTLVGAVAAGQALSCTATAFGIGATVVLGCVLSLCCGTTIYATQEDMFPGLLPSMGWALAILSWAYSCYAINHARGRNEPAFTLSVLRNRVVAEGQRMTTGGPLRIQVWFEWRRVVRWMLLVSAGMIGIIMVNMKGGNGGPDASALMLLFVLCWAAGYLLLRVQGSSENLCARLPWSTNDLARAKLLAGVVAIAGILVMVAIWAMVCAERHPLPPMVHPSTMYLGGPPSLNGLAPPQNQRDREDFFKQQTMRQQAFAERMQLEPGFSPWMFFGAAIYSSDGAICLIGLGALLFATLMAGRMLLPLLLGGYLLGSIVTEILEPLPHPLQVLVIPLVLGGLAAAGWAGALYWLHGRWSRGALLQSAGWLAAMAGSLWITDMDEAELLAFSVMGLELLVLLAQACKQHGVLPGKAFRLGAIVVILGAIVLYFQDFVNGGTASEWMLLLSAICCLVTIPFYWVPLSLHWQRHG